MAARTRYDPRIHTGRPMVAATEFLYDGVQYKTGDDFPTEGLHRTKIVAMYGARRINFADDVLAGKPAPATEPEAETGPATIEAQPGGYYLVGAPWLDEPERIRGKAAAEARADEINTAGEPDSHHGFTLTAGENGWYAITRADDDAEEPVALNVHGEDAAREAVATLRRGELIEGTPLPDEWTPAEPPAAGDRVVLPESSGDLAGQTGVVDSIDGDDAVVLVNVDGAPPETVTVALADLKPALGDPEAESLKVGDEATVALESNDLDGVRVTLVAINGEDADVEGQIGDELHTGTVPLASLTPAPPAEGNDQAEPGADDEPSKGE